jgi:AraC-like DNA-binding protein
MYSACLFCHADLGHNEVLDALTVGRRVAFDPARGRLWVVCTSCGRWNLTPFEERWETLEDCERLFRRTRLRYSTDNIGLAQPRSGFELVRIGAALRDEIAAWRYGTKLLSRAPTMAGYAQSLGMSQRAVMRLRTMPRRHTALTRVWLGHDRVPLRYAHLPHAELLRPDRDEVWRLRVRHDHGVSLLEGPEALKVARTLLTALNDGTAHEDMVNAALEKLDDAGHADGYFARVGALARSTSWGRVAGSGMRDDELDTVFPRPVAERVIVRLTTRSFWSRGGTGSEDCALLHRIGDVDRLALEMAANEDAERVALEGELDQLRDAWREAEEVAAIADRLLA